jgi:hypothetical protein
MRIVRAALGSVIFRKILVHARTCFETHVTERAVTTSATTNVTPAITHSMLALCSAACKALRFASTALTRGLRALTLPARSRRSAIA